MTPYEIAHTWIVNQLDQAAEDCRLETVDGRSDPCPGHIANAILCAGVEVSVAWAPYGQDGRITIMLPIYVTKEGVSP